MSRLLARVGVFGSVLLLLALFGVPVLSQTLTITSPADQAHLDLIYGEFFDVSWTCTSSTTEMELWVDGRAYCSYCGSGYSGTIYDVDSWMIPPFLDQCWHTLQLKAIVGIGWVYSAPIWIYDQAILNGSCPEPLTCEVSAMGGPVDVASGKMWYDQEDLRMEGPLPMAFSRRYNQRLEGANGPLGFGWTHSYALSVWTSLGAGHLRNAEGREILFASRLEGGFANNLVHHLSLAAITGGYRVTAKDQTQYNFNTGGKLTSIVDRNGNILTLAYDGSSRLSTITDPFGRAFTLGYDGSNRIISLADGTRTVSYGYDGAGNLLTTLDATLKTWTYAYDASHRLLSITDPLAHVAEAFTYDGADRVASFHRDSGNEALSFAYTSPTLTTVTNSIANATSFTLDRYNGVATAISGPGCASCGTGTNESYLRDAYLNKTQITDGDGNVTKQTFDAWGDVLTRTEAFGTALQRTTTYTYDPSYHFLTTVTVPSVDTGGQNRVESYAYDASGNLLTENLSGYSNGSAFSYTTTTTYDSHGQVLTVDGPRTDVSDVTTYAYYSDSDSDLAKRGRLHTLTDALGHVVTVNSYTLSGKPTATVDQNGVERDDSYDALDRLSGTTLKNAGPAGEDLTTSTTLNDAGLPTLVAFPNGNTVGYGYDTVNRLTSITDQPGNKTVYTFDTEGRKTREDLQDPSASVTKFTNYAYDAYNRLQYVYYNAIAPPGAGSVYWAYAYDNAGNQASVMDPQGHLTCFEYDALNRKTKTHQYLGTPPAACLGTCTFPPCSDLLTQYGYDAQDHVTSVTDPGTFVTTYAVDDAAKAIRQVSPDTGTTTYAYDPAGNQTSKANANGITETRPYDALNRLTGLLYPDTSNNVGYTYDSAGVTHGTGRRTGMTDPAGASVFCYDAPGHLTEETRTPAGQGTTFTQYAYDPNGNLAGITYPSGRSLAFTINTSDQVTAASALVNGASTAVVSSIAYEPFGPHTAMTFGNGLADARSYDTRHRLGTWTLGSLISKTTTWQDDDTITGITDNLNSANNRTFGYDEIHRLTTANGPWGSGSYSYDANGNRLSKTEGASSTSYTYTAGTNRLATATGSEPGTYTCDSNGNTAGDGTHTYQYSQRDRLATADSGTTGSDSYDGDGRRVLKTAGGVTTLYFYDPDGKLLEEYIPATATGKDYVWLPGTYGPLARVDFGLADTDNGDVLRCTKSSSNVHLDWSLDSASGPFVVERSTSFTFSSPQYLGPAQSTKTFDDGVLGNTTAYAYEVFRRTLTDTLYFYHADHLGTPLAMTNGAGAFVWRAEHTPFGGIYAMPVATIENNLRFPGQYWDGETGLSQNWHRDYAALLGRYYEADPWEHWADRRCGILNPQEAIFPLPPSPYEYTHGNPIVRKDPSGLHEFTCDYYANRAKVTKCPYYSWAKPTCEWFKEHEPYGHDITTCIGQCLQGYDKKNCAQPCATCKDISKCNAKAHSFCYFWCGLANLP